MPRRILGFAAGGVLAIAAFVALACASASRTYTPSGKPGFSIDCSGRGLNWNACYEKAGKLCGFRGYEIVDKSEDGGRTVVGVTANPVQRSMLIECH